MTTKGGELIFFRGVATGKLSTSQLITPHLGTRKQVYLSSVGYF